MVRQFGQECGAEAALVETGALHGIPLHLEQYCVILIEILCRLMPAVSKDKIGQVCLADRGAELCLELNAGRSSIRRRHFCLRLTQLDHINHRLATRFESQRYLTGSLIIRLLQAHPLKPLRPRMCAVLRSQRSSQQPYSYGAQEIQQDHPKPRSAPRRFGRAIVNFISLLVAGGG